MRKKLHKPRTQTPTLEVTLNLKLQASGLTYHSYIVLSLFYFSMVLLLTRVLLEPSSGNPSYYCPQVRFPKLHVGLSLKLGHGEIKHMAHKIPRFAHGVQAYAILTTHGRHTLTKNDETFTQTSLHSFRPGYPFLRLIPQEHSCIRSSSTEQQ